MQGEMDQANQNRMLAQAIGGLSSGVQGMAGMQAKQQRLNKVQEALAKQHGLFDELAKSPDKFEKMFANENILKLGLLQAGLDLSNVDSMGDSFKGLFSSSIFEPLMAMERARMMAEGMSQKEAAKKAYLDRVYGLAEEGARKKQDPFGLQGFSSVSAPFVQMMKQGGNLFDSFMQGSSGVGVDYNPYIEQSLNDL